MPGRCSLLIRGKHFRYEYNYNLETTDLIVWIKVESYDPLDVSLTPDN